MEENFISEETPQYSELEQEMSPSNMNFRPQNEYSPFGVISVWLIFFVAFNIIGSGIIVGWSKFNGLDFTVILSTISENSPIKARNFMRVILFLNHLFSFILPSLATVLFIYKKTWVNYLKLDRQPLMQTIILGTVWFLVSTPFVQLVYQFNKLLPLPHWLLNFETDTNNVLGGIIAQTNFYEIVVNVFVIGVVPAIGEEMVFRGILQQQIGKIFKNEHIVVCISAAIFSAIHMQFQGFFARMLLGAMLGYMFIWTKNLWIPIILHLLNNGLQVIGFYIAGSKPSEMNNSDKIPLWLGLLSCVLTIWLGMYIRRTQSEKTIV